MQKIILANGTSYELEDEAEKEVFNKIGDGATWLFITSKKTKIQVCQIVEIKQINNK